MSDLLVPELPPLGRRRARDLSRAELRAFVAELAARPDLWRERVRHDPDQRIFEPLGDDGHVEAWLICWMEGHDTGFHDHDLWAGAVQVVEGAVIEQRLVLDGPPSEGRYGPGSAFDFSAVEIHRVLHRGGAPAVTLHAYSPPLRRMGAYEIGASGALRRHPLAKAQELRPVVTS